MNFFTFFNRDKKIFIHWGFLRSVKGFLILNVPVKVSVGLRIILFIDCLISSINISIRIATWQDVIGFIFLIFIKLISGIIIIEQLLHFLRYF